MKSTALNPRLRIQVNSRTLLSLLAAESVLLSVLHHRYNFWGWPWDKQALIILLVAPGLAYVLQFLLAPVWPDLLRIGWRRWVLFLLPAVGIAALAAWHYLAVPETQHELEIVPSAAQGAGDFQLLEIKGAYGNEVPLSSFSNIEGWTIKNGVLVSDNPAPQPILYSFAGPVGEQMRDHCSGIASKWPCSGWPGWQEGGFESCRAGWGSETRTTGYTVPLGLSRFPDRSAPHCH